jgi:diguanylate cyclase (GGDEF)-like protein
MVAPGGAFALRASVQRLSTIIFAAIIVLSTALLSFIVYAGWSANSNAIDREQQLIETAINQRIVQTLSEDKSVAWWDDAVLAMRAPAKHRDFIRSNFGVFLSETYGHSEIYIIGGDDKPILAYAGHDLPPSAFEGRRALVQPIITAIRNRSADGMVTRDQDFTYSSGRYRDLIAPSLSRWHGHILKDNGKPVVVAAMSIVPNNTPRLLDPLPPILISIVRLDTPLINKMGRSLLIPDLAIEKTIENKGERYAYPISSDDGKFIGWVSWTPKRPGQVLLTTILPMVLLAMIGVASALFGVLRKLRKTSIGLESSEAESRHQATHDLLSGLPNRRHFSQVLGTILSSPDMPMNEVTVLYIDVDRFKDVNDTLGHEAGDALIMSVASRLRNATRPTDLLARLGGDEFAVLRRNNPGEDPLDLARKIAAQFNKEFDIADQSLHVTVSIGLATAPRDGRTVAEIMRHSDIALYEAKARGRNLWAAFAPEMASSILERRQLESNLRRALAATDELELYYQPIICAETGKVGGLEALLRWHDPVRGFIPPTEFIPIAENSGLMEELGLFVLDHAIAEAARWPEQTMAINLSPLQLRSTLIVKQVKSLLAKHKVEPERVILEITEGVLLSPSPQTRIVMKALRQLGLKLSLDDFGTGYSGLSYLQAYEFDQIKIDRSFVSGIEQSEQLLSIVQAVILVARAHRLTIVAEGIETAIEHEIMAMAGCTELQGYRFSRPLPSSQIGEIVRRLARDPQLPPRSVEGSAAA